MSNCILCNLDQLEHLYTPPTTRRGIEVYVCANCGMVQSWPRDREGDGRRDNTVGAGYGNLRTGKVHRAGPNMDFIKSSLPSFTPLTLADIGASRGAFLRLALQQWPDVMATAYEPDSRLSPPVDLEARVNWVRAGVEDIGREPKSYDLVYMSHTLEHVADPLEALKVLTILTRPTSSWLMVETPNLAGLSQDDVVEEFFLDKHVNHFSYNTLQTMLSVAGWAVIFTDSDDFYLSFLCAQASGGKVKMTNESALVHKLVRRYVAHREANLDKVEQRVERLNEVISTKQTIAWGQGRIFDMLMRHGLDVRGLAAIVDEIEPGAVRPEDVADPEAVIVCSREYEWEIRAKAGELWPEAEVWSWI